MHVQGQVAPQGSPISKGQSIRLLHSTTDRWLHSHHFKSPLTSQQEVSAFGSKVQSDTGDSWSVWWDSSAQTWTQDMTVRISCSALLPAWHHHSLRAALHHRRCRRTFVPPLSGT